MPHAHSNPLQFFHFIFNDYLQKYSIKRCLNLKKIDIDPDKINQVFLNLYLNAIQAMEGGGALSINAHNAAKEDMIDIVIKDTGCGIKDDDLGKIVDPYFTTKKNGTGLGQAIVYKIIEEHGGTIEFESRIDVGTTNTLSLPTSRGGQS